MAVTPRLLTDPFLQLPTPTSIRVVWFTEFPGSQHFVTYGPNLTTPAEKSCDRTVMATSSQLSRTREDQKSHLNSQVVDLINARPEERQIWRHEAIVNKLTPGVRVPYQVTSVQDEQVITSRVFSLMAQPTPQTALKILLTSDHQLKPLVSANLQKVVETVGAVDAVFFAGDLVNIPDRASEWFDDNRGGAFFPVLQGRAAYKLEKQGQETIYRGGEIIQHAPLFTTIGNHEVMGRFSIENSLSSQFDDAVPRAIASARYPEQAQSNQPADDSTGSTARAAWIKDHSFNTDTYEEIFTLPTSETGGKTYYAVTFGDIRLVVLYATSIWRVPEIGPEIRGKYSDPVPQPSQQAKELSQLDQDAWGYGQHIFEPIAQGSKQYQWLQQELNSPEFQQAKYKVVMLHHPLHSLGGNIVPPYTDPITVSDRAPDSTIQAIRYEYPRESNYLIRDVLPLLEAAGVQLVFYGHCHLWNRFVSPSGMHFLETSNVGNSYGAYLEQPRPTAPSSDSATGTAIGNPNGLAPVVPTIAPLKDENGRSLPYLSSNDLTAFSIFNTADGTVSSYYFDTRQPQSSVIKFDEFQLLQTSTTKPATQS
ncbi:metallophosphoesterase [Trichocoleus sp. FACHB-262]|uniref:metallophosphoesterase family protein n=1 Tax=Trichocoleus sp. FACHB-262 TaxID=2692869 RepID=UPI0016885AD1|nr:metallophosphoesterase [Trichocoleus sp. FACHB-262]MBD2121219.1 metallophosphoesterase [Trichocoleus sp. FACHB-262]